MKNENKMFRKQHTLSSVGYSTDKAILFFIIHFSFFILLYIIPNF